jgi:hypothetical protein
VLSWILLLGGGDAIAKRFFVCQVEEVEGCPMNNKSTTPFSAFIVN